MRIEQTAFPPHVAAPDWGIGGGCGILLRAVRPARQHHATPRNEVGLCHGKGQTNVGQMRPAFRSSDFAEAFSSDELT